jgi:hypothetical protein
MALSTQLNLITNCFGGQQVWNAFFPLAGENKSDEKMRQNAVLPALSIFGRALRWSLNKIFVVPAYFTSRMVSIIKVDKRKACHPAL